MSYLCHAIAAAAMTVYVGGAVLSVVGKLPDKWYYAVRMAADGGMLIRQVILLGLEQQRFSLWVPFWLGLFWWDWRQWTKHRNDDDDWGDRVRSWVRSHIPKPTVVRIRPVEVSR